ncbi:MAG: hypothetical protein JJV89_02045 [Desulfosarcina sp.]|nr:hypothetical protein [Desulfobacterales bacterium]
MDYLLAQSLSLFFYIITLLVYNRARKEYPGGKIAAAINLIMVSLVILFLCDFADYFFPIIFPIADDTILIIKILLRLISFCVLFFGGLRFFVNEPVDNKFFSYVNTNITRSKDTQSKHFDPDRSAELTVIIKDNLKPNSSSITKSKPETGINYFKKHNLAVIISFFVILCISISYYLLWGTNEPVGSINKKLRKETFQDKSRQPDNITKEQKQKIQIILARIEQEKKRENEILDRIKKSKEEEQKILDRIEKEHQKKLEQAAAIEQKKNKEAERAEFARIKEKKRAEKKRLRKIEKKRERELRAKAEQEKTEAIELKEIKILDSITASAQKALTQKKYSGAKQSYETALNIIKESSFKDNNKFLKYRIKIENSLRDEKIIFGSQGYIYYKNIWLSPGEYEKKLYSEGFVKYKKKTIKFTNMKDSILRLTNNHVKAYLTYRYRGRNIHKKQIKFDHLILKKSTSRSSVFTIFYKWEVWTFNEQGDGICSLDAEYNVEQDKWKITRACEAE